MNSYSANSERGKGLWKRAITATFLMCACIAVFAFRSDRFVQGRNDFLPLYTSARLVGTEKMYSPQAAEAEQLAVAGLRMVGGYHIRPPFYAAALKPIALLPYRTAYWVWQAINIACFAMLVRFWLLPRQYGMLTAVFFPVFHAIWTGQDALMVTLCVAGFVSLITKRGQIGAGCLLALCAAKFHLFLFVPLALAVNRQWRVIASATVGIVMLALASCAVSGWDWPNKYVPAILHQDASLNLDLMPNLYTILRQIGVSSKGQLVMAAILAFTICVGIWREKNIESSLGVALVGGILISPHVYVYDCVLLLVALPCVSPQRGWARCARLAAWTPVPYLLFFFGDPLNVLLPLLMLAVVGDSSLPQRRSLARGAA